MGIHPSPRLPYLVQLPKTQIFDPLPGKNDLHIRIPAGFSGSGVGKLRGEKCLDSRAFGGLWEIVFANSKLIQSANPKLIHPI